MKIQADHYNYMKTAIAMLNIDAMREEIIKEGRAKDVEKRLRWDCSYRAGLTPWICANLYSYMDDTHIDTALRSIIRELSA